MWGGEFPGGPSQPGAGGSGGGSVDEITSDDATVTITNPTGPTVDLSVPGAAGTVTEITSEDASVTITNPDGPVVDLSVAGGGGGWPTDDGTGSGNLVANTGFGDTTGYNMTDAGTGGIHLTTSNQSGSTFTVEDGAGSTLFMGDGISTFSIGMTAIGENISLTNNGTTGGDIIIRQAQAGGSGSITIEVDNPTGTVGIIDSGGGIFLNLTGPLQFIGLPITDPANANQVFIRPDGSLAISEAATNVANAGHLAADFTPTGTLTTYLTTASLGIGKWLITHGANARNLAASTNLEIEANPGTATATFEGVTSGDVGTGSGVIVGSSVCLSFIATVTVAGTIVFQAKDAGSSQIAAETQVSTFGKATGYTAIPLPS